jgi:phosphoglycerate dehydrogenase-like enzyme
MTNQAIDMDRKPLHQVVILNDFPPGYYAERPEALAPLSDCAEIRIYNREAASPAELSGWLASATAAIDIRSRTRFDAALLECLPRLRVLVVRGTTAPLVNLEAASRLGVVVCNTPYQSTVSVSEFAIGLLFAAVRRIPLMHGRLQRAEWHAERGFELRGKTLGIVGLGMIGQETARLGRALGMRVLVWSPTRDEARAASCGGEIADLDDLLKASDVVSLHLRLSDTTRGIIGKRELGLLKDGAILINTARSGILDEQALIDELRSGRIMGAIDVFGKEPIAADHPLLGLDHVIVTPHAAYATRDVIEERTRVPIGLVKAALSGRPNNVMNPAALEHPAWRLLQQGDQAGCQAIPQA